jgi:lipoprotein-anchoring transpeptidase ErfK/SrfK
MEATTTATQPACAGLPAILRGFIALVVLLVLLAGAAFAAYTLFEQRYADRIYPGISIDDFDVGDLSPQQAAVTVEQNYARSVAIFDSNGTKWFARWSDIGISVNAREAAQQAFAIGRAGRPDERYQAWQVRQPIHVSFSFDPAAARRFLEQHRAEVYVAPHDADVALGQAQAAAVASSDGREIDVDATLPDVFALALRNLPIPVRSRPIRAALTDVSPAVTQLNDWFNRPFALELWWDNALITRTVTAQDRAGWLRVERTGNDFTTQLIITGVHDFLGRVNAELSPEAAMRLDEATALTFYAFNRGDPSVWLVVPHAEFAYTIQRGDTYEGLGDHFGIPVQRLLAANPDIWQTGFVPGLPITIPSQNIMLPVPISPTNLQRIEVNLSTQQLFAYDGPARVLSASISSGIPKWRTLIGVFQVQERVDEAYNKLAHISMPNWLSIYDLGEPGESLTNGIHALPVLGGGRRLWSGWLGKPVSFGCVVMGIEDSAALYKWVQLGTPVVIYGQTPPSPLNYDDLIEAQKKTESPQPAETPAGPAPTPAAETPTPAP